MNLTYGIPSTMSHSRYEFGSGSNIWGDFIENKNLLSNTATTMRNNQTVKVKQPIILYL